MPVNKKKGDFKVSLTSEQRTLLQEFWGTDRIGLVLKAIVQKEIDLIKRVKRKNNHA